MNQNRTDATSWFEDLTGIRERSPDHVRARLDLRGERLISKANGRSWRVGRLETPSLYELRQRVARLDDAPSDNELRLSEHMGDVRDLHADPANAGAMFQVASQFNLLEMMRPDIRPEHGIGAYEHDPTQGPACATACGAGTIFRNYLVDLAGQRGQSRHHQIDCLAALGERLGNRDSRLWEMRNGYALASEAGLREIAGRLEQANEDGRERLRSSLRIGINRDTEVTLPGAGHTVSQGFCSALPVAYGQSNAAEWEPFARLVLEAAYDAVFCAARLNRAATGNDALFLTLLGGGAFGNREEWIIDAIAHAAARHADSGLNLKLVSWGRPQDAFSRLIEKLQRAQPDD
jgi:hypothetical protein